MSEPETAPPAPQPLTGSLRVLRDQSQDELDTLSSEIADLSNRLAAKTMLYGRLLGQHILAKAQGL